MYKSDLALNNLQWLICHQTKLNQTKPYLPSCGLNSTNTVLLQGWLWN